MPAFPTLMHLRTGSVERDSGTQTARATNGSLRQRTLYPSDKADFQLVLWCTAAQKSGLDTFYANNRLGQFLYTDPADGATYTVRFAGPPLPVDMTPYWEVRVRLRQV